MHCDDTIIACLLLLLQTNETKHLKMEFVQYVVQILPQISTEVTAHEFSCENDRDILIDFYRQTGGDDWRINFNWLSEKPLENWYGVKVNDKGRVVSLDLRTNRLDGSIPESIGRLSDLRTLNLMSNRLQGYPRAFSGQ